MRVYLTGGSGFVGSNLAQVLAEHHGAELCAPLHRSGPQATVASGAGPGQVELTDRIEVLASIAAFEPDVVVHAAILNDLARCYADRRAGWESYVDATRHVVDAANAAGAHVVLISTDWVFDGTGHLSDESVPPNPVNLYGVLKMASELVVAERARSGAVARISGVNGMHWARPATPRAQDAGFGYLVLSIVESLRAGRRFELWDSPSINEVATPSLASDCAELIARISQRRLCGVFHCCGGEAVSRVQLARATADLFGLDASLISLVDPPPQATTFPVPRDTSLDARATAAALGVQLPSLADQLARLRVQIDERRIAPWPGSPWPG